MIYKLTIFRHSLPLQFYNRDLDLLRKQGREAGRYVITDMGGCVIESSEAAQAAA